MSYKVFVSYKFHDDNVQNLSWNKNSNVRDYVNELEKIFSKEGNVIYKGEHDNENLSYLSDNEIWEKLKDRIYDSSITIVLISPRMKESFKRERDQWIPWEISYSLKEMPRGNRVSHSNAMIAVVLPDTNGSYEYYLSVCRKCNRNCRIHHTDKLFQILRDNKFNLKDGDNSACNNDESQKIWSGENFSYIEAVKWDDFINNCSKYMDKAIHRKDKIDEYEITKEIKA